MQKELPVLSEFVAKILRVHGAGHPELARVHQLFCELKMELEPHLIKEEEILFPLIKELEQNRSDAAREQVKRIIGELEREHSGAGGVLKELRSVTNDYMLPAEACRTYALSFHKLEELESDLFQHIHLENNILFPRVMQETASGLQRNQGRCTEEQRFRTKSRESSLLFTRFSVL